MTGATFKNAFVDFEIEYQLVQSESRGRNCERHIELRIPFQTRSRRPIEDLHADVSDAIETGLKCAS